MRIIESISGHKAMKTDRHKRPAGDTSGLIPNLGYTDDNPWSYQACTVNSRLQSAYRSLQTWKEALEYRERPSGVLLEIGLGPSSAAPPAPSEAELEASRLIAQNNIDIATKEIAALEEEKRTLRPNLLGDPFSRLALRSENSLVGVIYAGGYLVSGPGAYILPTADCLRGLPVGSYYLYSIFCSRALTIEGKWRKSRGWHNEIRVPKHIVELSKKANLPQMADALRSIGIGLRGRQYGEATLLPLKARL